MWRVWMILGAVCPIVAHAQYVDTIQGKIEIRYNEPRRFRIEASAGGQMETQGISGSVMIPAVYAEARIKPTRFLLLHGNVSHQFQLGWKYQDIMDTRTAELGARIYLRTIRLDKWKTFTAGNGMWNYDYTFPVKVAWDLGISGSYRLGTGVFNSGNTNSTSVRFLNHFDGSTGFLEKAAVPYSFSEVSAGFVVSTTSRMKMIAHLPSGAAKARRMKTFTEFRIEAVLANQVDYDSVIVRKPTSDATRYFTYDVHIQEQKAWGFRMVGFFRRKWLTMRLETGVRPGINYRFSDSEKPTPIDRSYLMLGFGFGWM